MPMDGSQHETRHRDRYRTCKPCGIGTVGILHRLREDLPGFLLKLGDGVPAAPGAGLGHFSADQAFSSGETQLLPIHLPSVRAQHVHIKQPPHGSVILDLHSDRLYRVRIGVQQEKGLVSGFLLNFLKMQDGNARSQQLLPEKLSAQEVTTGYLARYAAMVTSGNRGAILEVPKAK